MQVEYTIFIVCKDEDTEVIASGLQIKLFDAIGTVIRVALPETQFGVSRPERLGDCAAEVGGAWRHH